MRHQHAASDRLVFENVTKSFRDRTAPRTLRDAIPSAFRMLTGGQEPERSRFFALRDVSLRVAEGEALGLVGRNGAGKSTSLKLAAGVFRPDSGRIETRGPIASMIELSAGFHPDLTGRENVYLNAALLGLRRREITQLMGPIVEFSGIGNFIEAPLRVYSSGMIVRLGFAVASHVPAKLLLVDEVLAVGDIEFRSRCVERMAERRREGVSVLFVSHNLPVVERFCDRVVLVDGGRKAMEGEASAVLDEFRRRMLSEDDGAAGRRATLLRQGDGRVTIESVEARGPDRTDALEHGRPGRIVLHVSAEVEVPPPTFGIEIASPEGTALVRTEAPGRAADARPFVGRGQVVLELPRVSLMPGVYALSVYARDREGIADHDRHSRSHRVVVVGERAAGESALISLDGTWSRP